MNTTVKLNDQELDLARKIASLRHGSSREAGVYNAKVGPQSNFETDFSGMCGEIAFCKLFNCYPDLAIVAGGADYDCIVQGLRVDIKTTKYPKGRLLSSAKKEYPNIDVFALMTGDVMSGEFRFAGWARSDEIRSEENISEEFKGSYKLEQEDLHDAYDIDSGRLYEE